MTATPTSTVAVATSVMGSRASARTILFCTHLYVEVQGVEAGTARTTNLSASAGLALELNRFTDAMSVRTV